MTNTNDTASVLKGNLWQEAFDEAWKDPDFAEDLLKDPHSALAKKFANRYDQQTKDEAKEMKKAGAGIAKHVATGTEPLQPPAGSNVGICTTASTAASTASTASTAASTASTATGTTDTTDSSPTQYLYPPTCC